MRGPAPTPRRRVPHEGADARLVEIATEHLRRLGPRLTIVGVAREAGMSHANVYRYFPSKEALVDAVTTSWAKPLEASLRTAADASDPAGDKLERMLFAIHRAYRAKREADPIVFRLFAQGIEAGTGAARKHRARVQGEIARVVEEGIAAGAFPIADARRAVALVFDATHRFVHPGAVAVEAPVGRAALEQRFERVLALVLRALKTGRPGGGAPSFK